MEVEVFRWWFVDEATGTLRITALHMTREDAGRLYPSAQADLGSREFWDIPDDSTENASSGDS